MLPVSSDITSEEELVLERIRKRRAQNESRYPAYRHDLRLLEQSATDRGLAWTGALDRAAIELYTVLPSAVDDRLALRLQPVYTALGTGVGDWTEEMPFSAPVFTRGMAGRAPGVAITPDTLRWFACRNALARLAERTDLPSSTESAIFTTVCDILVGESDIDLWQGDSALRALCLRGCSGADTERLESLLTRVRGLIPTHRRTDAGIWSAEVAAAHLVRGLLAMPVLGRQTFEVLLGPDVQGRTTLSGGNLQYLLRHESVPVDLVWPKYLSDMIRGKGLKAVLANPVLRRDPSIRSAIRVASQSTATIVALLQDATGPEQEGLLMQLISAAPVRAAKYFAELFKAGVVVRPEFIASLLERAPQSVRMVLITNMHGVSPDDEAHPIIRRPARGG